MHASRRTSITAILVGAALLLALPASSPADIVRSGFVEMEAGAIPKPPGGHPPVATLVEYLQNPGFESGALPPWTTNNWAVVTSMPHSGAYAAYDIGNFWIRQDFNPIDTADVLSVTFWAKQPEPGTQIQAFDFFYDDNTFDEDIWIPPDDYGQMDITSFLRPPGNILVALRIWGYVGGGPDPDETWLDDVSIQVGATAVEPGTWGQVKSLFRP